MSSEKVDFIKDFKAKDAIKSTFVVKYIAVMEAKDGREYLNIILADKSGEIEARKWHGARKVIDEISRGDYCYLEGKVNQFQNRLQLIINEIKKVEEVDVDESTLIFKSESGPEVMLEKLLNLIESLDDVYIRDLLKSIIFEFEIKRRLQTWQAGKSIHHAYKSGLLEHILSCAEMADFLSGHYKVNRNFVLAGAILHDICKIYELTDGTLIDYTEEGRLLGHVVKVVELVDHFSSKIKNFPYATKTHLKHILLSHHGEYEYGSPKIPKTSEALLVHYIDLLDSKMNAFETVKRNDNCVGNWSGYVRHLDRMVFKSELPHYSDYVSREEVDENPSKGDLNGKKKKHRENKELKHNMSDMLKNFKLDK